MRIYLKLLITTFFIVPLVCNSQDWSETKSIWWNPSSLVYSQPEYLNVIDPSRIVFNPIYIGFSNYTDKSKRTYYRRSFSYRIENHLFKNSLTNTVPPNHTSLKIIHYRVRTTELSWENHVGINLNSRNNLHLEFGIAIDYGVYNHVFIDQEEKYSFINGEPGGIYDDRFNNDIIISNYASAPNFRLMSELAYDIGDSDFKDRFQVSFTTNYKLINYKRFITESGSSRKIQAKNLVSLGLKLSYFFHSKE